MGGAFTKVQERERLLLEKARRMEYKEIAGGDNLSIYFYLPRDLETGPRRPLLLFFNDGGWDRGNIVQFAPQALYYVERGAVCGLVQYRNRSSHPESHPLHSERDGESAFGFVRRHAESLHIDVTKVVGVGAGAGANIVACLSLKSPPAEKEEEETSGHGRPDAAVLISTLFEVKKGSYGYDQFPSAAEAKQVDLSRFVRAGVAPMLIVHGTADRISPLESALEFSSAMKRKKNDCELIEFEGRDHSFFNLNVDPVSYEASLTYIDRFLDRIDLLPGKEGEAGARVILRAEEDY